MRQDADGDPRLARLLGEAAMTLGDDAAAVRGLRGGLRVVDPAVEPSMSLSATGRRWCHVGDLAEAAVVCGELATVRPLVNELAITAGAVPSPGLRAAVAHARAVLGSGSEESAELFIEAREAAVVRGPLATGRVRLVYEIWRRRHRQVAEARLELRSAFGGV